MTTEYINIKDLLIFLLGILVGTIITAVCIILEVFDGGLVI
jgi:hypothetical protein